MSEPPEGKSDLKIYEDSGSVFTNFFVTVLTSLRSIFKLGLLSYKEPAQKALTALKIRHQYLINDRKMIVISSLVFTTLHFLRNLQMGSIS
jgi:hypothetical protein